MKYKHSKKHRNNRKKYITFVVDFKITLSFNKQLTLTSMGKYNFDQLIDRRGSRAMKIDRLEAMFGRTDLTSMWIADMDFAVCPQIIEALQERISHPIYGYSCPSDGYWQSLIKWLRDCHEFDVTQEELTFVPGVVRGIAYAVNYFTQKGDKVIIQPPVYHPFKSVVEGNDRVVLNNPLIMTDVDYEMDFEHLEHLMKTENPRMLILCNPHNPAGVQWSVETLQRLASLCRKYDVKVVSDEIHGDLMLYGKPHYPFAMVSDDAAAVSITLGAPSKTFNIPGLVSSWYVIKNPELREPFYKWLTANEFNSSTFMATIATEAAYTHGGEWLKEAATYIEQNIAAVEDFCKNNMPVIKPMRPQASFLVWLDCRELGLEQAELVDMFVNKAGLALNDGTMFGKEGAGFMRLNVGCPKSVLIAALEKLANAINNL